MPDPNFFSGDLLISKKDEEWKSINNDQMLLGIPNKEDNDGSIVANYRGIGLSDMVNAIQNSRKARCSIDLSLHVLEIMQGIITSSESKSICQLTTKPSQPKFLGEEEIKNLINF